MSSPAKWIAVQHTAPCPHVLLYSCWFWNIAFLNCKLQHFTPSFLQNYISGLGFKWTTWPICPFCYRIELWLMLLLLSCCKCPPLSVQSLFTVLIFSYRLYCHHYFVLDWVSSSVVITLFNMHCMQLYDHICVFCVYGSTLSLSFLLFPLLLPEQVVGNRQKEKKHGTKWRKRWEKKKKRHDGRNKGELDERERQVRKAGETSREGQKQKSWKVAQMLIFASRWQV